MPSRPPAPASSRAPTRRSAKRRGARFEHLSGARPAPSSDTVGDGPAPSATGTAGIRGHDGQRSGVAIVPAPGSSDAWTGVLHDAEALVGSARYSERTTRLTDRQHS